MEHFTNIETEFSETINSKVFRNEDASVELRHLDEMIEKEDRLVTRETSISTSKDYSDLLRPELLMFISLLHILNIFKCLAHLLTNMVRQTSTVQDKAENILMSSDLSR